MPTSIERARTRAADFRKKLARSYFTHAKQIIRDRFGDDDLRRYGARSALQSALYPNARAREIAGAS